jgi:hypothetical protein
MRVSLITSAFLTLLVMTTTASADAQDLRLTGRVLSDSAKPLQNVLVVLEGTGIGAITDTDGKYAFIYSAARLHGQTGRLTASLLGYRTTSVDVVLSGTSNVQNFALAPVPIHLIVDPVILLPPYTMTTGDFVRERADVVHAAGLKDLWSNHPSGQRELRIWTARVGSLELVRMVERSDVVHGELFDYDYWQDERTRNMKLRFQRKDNASHCSHITIKKLVFTCRTSIPDDADWKQPWDELQAAGIWDLPSDETWSTPILVDLEEGNPVTVELWDGSAYREWTYLAPNGLMGGDEMEGHERAYVIWRVTRGIELLSKR